MKAPTPPAQNGPALVGSGAVNGSAAPAMIPAVQASAVKAPVSQPPREKITGHPSSSENDRPESIASNALYTPPTGDRGRIFIVDDEPANVNIVRRLLERAGYRQFKSTTDSNVAFKMIQATRPDVVLLDINMPGISGVEVLRSLRGCPETSMLPVLILTANTQPAIKSQCLELGATDFLCKPVDPLELVPRVRNSLQAKAYQDQMRSYAESLEETVARRTMELEASRREIVRCLARAAEYRDNDTGNHVVRVGKFVGILASQLGFGEREAEDMELAAQLHDVGKIAIPDAILHKPGKLDDEEYSQMCEHVRFGRNIIEPFTQAEMDVVHGQASPQSIGGISPLMTLAARIAQTHHEKWDGSGYPLGLSGEDIPIEGRITAVADVYDALSSARPYKRPYPRERAFEILEDGRGKHFDPQVLDAFFGRSDEITKIQVALMDRC